MKQGSVPLLGVLSYAALILSTALLVALGLAQATWSLAFACALMVLAAFIATRARQPNVMHPRTPRLAAIRGLAAK